MPRTQRRPWLLLLLIGLPAALVLIALGIEQYLQEGPNYDEIEDGLYLGGHVKSPPRRTRAVLNLCEQPDPYTCEVHVHARIVDAAPAPSLNWLRTQVEWIDNQLREGRKTYVHCMNGVSRSAMVVAAYLMFKHDWTVPQSLEFIRTKRPIVRPNPAFMPLLEEWQKALHAPRLLPDSPSH